MCSIKDCSWKEVDVCSNRVYEKLNVTWCGKHNLEEFSRFFRNHLWPNLGQACASVSVLCKLHYKQVLRLENLKISGHTQSGHFCKLFWSLSLPAPLDGSCDLGLACKLWLYLYCKPGMARTLHGHWPVHISYLWAQPWHLSCSVWTQLTGDIDLGESGKGPLNSVRRELCHLVVS